MPSIEHLRQLGTDHRRLVGPELPDPIWKSSDRGRRRRPGWLWEKMLLHTLYQYGLQGYDDESIWSRLSSTSKQWHLRTQRRSSSHPWNTIQNTPRHHGFGGASGPSSRRCSEYTLTRHCMQESHVRYQDEKRHRILQQALWLSQLGPRLLHPKCGRCGRTILKPSESRRARTQWKLRHLCDLPESEQLGY